MAHSHQGLNQPHQKAFRVYLYTPKFTSPSCQQNAPFKKAQEMTIISRIFMTFSLCELLVPGDKGKEERQFIMLTLKE